MFIEFKFDTTGMNAPVISCDDPRYSCSCTNCQPACKGSINLNLTESHQCQIEMFGEKWLCLELGMALVGLCEVEID